MVVRLSEVCINCADPDAMAAFWSAVLGYREISRDADGIVLQGDPDQPTLMLARTEDPGGPPKVGPNRLHLDLTPRDGEQTTEVRRLEALGAQRVDIGQGDQTWVVLADPEGNEFCVLRPPRPVPPEDRKPLR